MRSSKTCLCLLSCCQPSQHIAHVSMYLRATDYLRASHMGSILVQLTVCHGWKVMAKRYCRSLDCHLRLAAKNESSPHVKMPYNISKEINMFTLWYKIRPINVTSAFQSQNLLSVFASMSFGELFMQNSFKSSNRSQGSSRSRGFFLWSDPASYWSWC